MAALPKSSAMIEPATRAVLKVGDGRGFVIETGQARYVVTAAHCLPHFPPAMSFGDTQDVTYEALLGQLGAEPSVWAECLFADPIGDIAVLGAPDGQELWDEAAAYNELVEGDDLFRTGDVLEEGTAVRLLDLDGRWIWCKAQAQPNGRIWLSEAGGTIKAGMSGSPIIMGDDVAVGIVCTSAGTEGDPRAHTYGGPQARLARNLPGWLLRELAT